MTIHQWTARFRDSATEAEFIVTQREEHLRRLGFLAWGLLALLGGHLLTEAWSGVTPLSRPSDLGLHLQVLIFLLCGVYLLYLHSWATQARVPALALLMVAMSILALTPLIVTDPHYEFGAPLVFICGTLLFYVYLPLDLAPRTRLCLIASLTLWGSWAFFRHPPPRKPIWSMPRSGSPSSIWSASIPPESSRSMAVASSPRCGNWKRPWTGNRRPGTSRCALPS